MLVATNVTPAAIAGVGAAAGTGEIHSLSPAEHQSVVEATLEARADLAAVAPSTIDDVLAVDGESRAHAKTLLGRFASRGASG